MATRTGGGINSKVNVSPSVRTGRDANKISPEGVAQIGAAVQFPRKPLVQGTGGYGVKYGNEVALNVGKGGPGTGRTVHASGSQGQHGPAAQGARDTAPDTPATKPGRDILSDYGPERGGR